MNIYISDFWFGVFIGAVGMLAFLICFAYLWNKSP